MPVADHSTILPELIGFLGRSSRSVACHGSPSKTPHTELSSLCSQTVEAGGKGKRLERWRVTMRCC